MGRRLLRIGKWTLFVLGALLALSPIAVYVLAWRAEQQLDIALKAIAARGEPVKLTQLAKPPIPDHENAALVYDKAFKAIKLSDKDKDLISEIASGKAPLSNPEIAAQAEKILNQNARALALIHKAVALPRCRFEIDWERGINADFPFFSKLRWCSRLLAFESALLARDGKVDAALKVCAENFRLSGAADEPILMGFLVRVAIIAIAERSLITILNNATPSGEVCRVVAGQIGKTDILNSYRRALEGERVTSLQLFGRLRSVRSPAELKRLAVFSNLDITKENSQAGADQESKGSKPSGLWRWWWTSDELSYLEHMDKAINNAELPYREAKKLLLNKEISVTQLHWWRPLILTAILMPVFDQSSAKRTQTLTILRQAQVALWLKAYRSDHGTYPQTLADLAPPDKSILVDPFSGKSLVYHHKGAGFILYSWGPNLKDDGGMPLPSREWLEKGDIVFQCSR